MHNEMMKTGSFDQQKVKLPKIDFKAKLTATDRINTPKIEGISAKSWLYYSESSQYGCCLLI